MKNVFLVGHGFIWGEPQNDFIIYPNVAVTFYCKNGKPFDSDWEDAVITKVKAGKVPTSQDIIRAKDDWEVSTYG